MTQEFFDALLWIAERAGYGVGAAFILLGLAALVGVFTSRDDGFQPIGESRPPAPRVSPFVNSSARPGDGADVAASAPGAAISGRGAGGSHTTYRSSHAGVAAEYPVVTPRADAGVSDVYGA